MNKSIFTQKNSNIAGIYVSTKSLATRLFMCVMILVGYQSANAQCDVTLGCQDNVQVSLDDACSMIVTPGLVLQNQVGPDSDYTVVVTDSDGDVVPGNQLTSVHINETLNVRVELNGCDLSCWGSIVVEDKLPPTILSCATPTDITCGEDRRPTSEGGVVPTPTATDACGFTSSEYYDVTMTLDCSTIYTEEITRTWVITDASGNSANCVQTIRVERADIDDVVFPLDYDDEDDDGDADGSLPYIECGVSFPSLPNGAPTPEFTGFPSHIECPNIQFHYTDIVFDNCGASFKVLRQWFVIDWCTGMEETDNQIIKIVDDRPPVVTCTPDTPIGGGGFGFIITTDPGRCTGTWNVEPPIEIFDCSETTYEVAYLLANEDGDPPVDGEYIMDNVSGSHPNFTISGLPQGRTWIRYIVTDACGMSTPCFTEIFVEDDEEPTPSCEGHTSITLSPDGWADAFAITFDDHSWDNCMIDTFLVKRLEDNCGVPDDLVFDNVVNFCCADVGETVKVVLRVFDKQGLFNDCIVNVTVLDKEAPTITCPINVTLNCTQDFTDLNLTGTATGTDNCGGEITHTDTESLDDCGIGRVTRRWQIEDASGTVVRCTQTIIIEDNDPLDLSDIIWPADVTVECDASDADPTDPANRPVLSHTGCGDIAISHNDNPFVVPSDDELCQKILRTWKIVDWCAFDRGDEAIFEYVQKIHIKNTVKPTFNSGCSNKTVNALNSECEAHVDLIALASDDCTPSSDIDYTWSIDLNSNGSIDHAGLGNDASGTYPVGTHKVTFTATDHCDNTETCMLNLTIRDDKDPTPVCISEVIWVIGEDGVAEIWASDFNLKSFDACTGETGLSFAFNSSGTQQVRTYTCADIPNGVAASIDIRMYVIDQSGNFDFCDVTLILQDSGNTNACTDMQGSRAAFTGKVMNEHRVGLTNIQVDVENMMSEEMNMEMTQDNGEFAFEVSYYDEYQVSPYKNNDPLTGVTTLDILLLQKHILGIQILDSPYKLIAGDINNSGHISSPDISELRKLILGVYTDFSSNTSWRFMPENHEFEDPTSPWDFPEKIVIEEVYLDVDSLDFLAVKVGDLNDSASSFTSQENSETRENKQIDLAAKFEINGNENTVTIPVILKEANDISGIQGAFNFDNKIMNYIGVIGQEIDVNSSNINVNEDLIAFSWDKIQGIDLPSDAILFELKFELIGALDKETIFSLNSDAVPGEWYNKSFDRFSLALEVDARNVAEESSFELFTNAPNPFKNKTTIKFSLTEDMPASISIFDLSGKIIDSYDFYGVRGINRLDIEIPNAESGIYYCQLKAGGQTAINRMVVIR